MALKLVVFDLDGTLIDTIEDLGNAVNHALASSSLPLHGTEEYRTMVGHGVRNLVRQALPEALRDSEEEVDRHLSLFIDYYSAHIADCSCPYPGIPELLAELDAMGVKLAVASNKFHSGTLALVSLFFPAVGFVSVEGNRPGALLKPDAGIIRSAVDAAGLCEEDLSSVFMVGDSATDVLTGHNAGVRSIAVSWGFRSRDSLVRAGADAVVDNVACLRDLLLESAAQV